MTTYTQDELDTAVAEAVAPLQAKLDDFLQKEGLADFEARLTEMTQAHEAKVAELQNEIDVAVAAAEAAKTERDEIVAFWDQVHAAAEAEAAAEARKSEIKEAVAGLFSEEHIEARLDRWAGLEPEAFETFLADAQAAAEAAKASTASDETVEEETPPPATAMQHGSDESNNVTDIRRSLMARGNDVRSVGASYMGGTF